MTNKSVDAPTNVVAKTVAGNPVISWDMPTTTPWVGGYEIYIGGTLNATVDGTVFEATQAYGSGSKTYTIKAISALGGSKSPSSSPATITCGLDTRFITVTNPINNGSFESGNLGWTIITGSVETRDAITADGMFFEKVLNPIKATDFYQDILIKGRDTYLFTCKGKGSVIVDVSLITGSVSWTPQTVSFGSSASRQTKIINAIDDADGIRINVKSTGSVNAVLDGLMLINLSEAFGHGAVVATDYTNMITEIDTHFGGYIEGRVKLPKEI